MNFFSEYASNTALSTSHNTRLDDTSSAARTYRSYIRPYLCGDFTWRFYFSNNVDSTFADGAFSRANLAGGCYQFSATVGIGRADKSVYGIKALTFDGSPVKTTSVGEIYLSDEIQLNVGENEYIVFSAFVVYRQGTVVPCTPDSRAFNVCGNGNLIFNGDTNGMTESGDCFIPDMLAVKRSVQHRICFIGDSITQGCGTNVDEYEQWAARIGNILSRDISLSTAAWNIGLGYALAQDAGSCGYWLRKAALNENMNISTDTASPIQNLEINLCLGVNDLSHGCRCADMLIEYLRAAIDGIRCLNPTAIITMFTIPPFDFDTDTETNRRIVNTAIYNLGANYIFDFAAILSTEPPYGGGAKYGPHPDGNGGLAVAEAYIKWYRSR